MALNMDAIGKKLGPLTKTYTWKDVVLYALGVGAGFNEPNYTYEKKLKVIPTFSVAIIFDLFRVVTTACNINVAGVLHGEQDLIFHNPIPPSGTMTTEGKITNYYDKGTKGALVVVESETFHGSSKKLFTSIITLFSRLDGGFGGKSAPHKTIVMPEREPDFIVEAKPSPDQPLVFRLSGDTFELHVDTEFAKIAGFEKPIMHGLCTYGFACRALVASLTAGEPERVRRLACRFAHPSRWRANWDVRPAMATNLSNRSAESGESGLPRLSLSRPHLDPATPCGSCAVPPVKLFLRLLRSVPSGE